MNILTRRRVVIASVCLVAVLAAGAGTWALVDLQTAPPSAAVSGAGRSGDAGGPGGSGSKGQHATAAVTKGDLTDSKVFAGTLGYAAATGVPGAAPGTLTWLPKPGQVIKSDDFLYTVDERVHLS